MNKIKNGFTLLELLVVVLIIGILASIALPQYQMAVGKSKFATLKNITKSIQESAQRYYILHGTYNLAAKDLDIDLNIIHGSDSRSFGLKEGIQCVIWEEGQQERVACTKTIFGKQVWLYIHRETGRPTGCLTYSTDKTDKSNRLCQKETGKTATKANCSTSYCYYTY